jgi:hypothetical protein
MDGCGALTPRQVFLACKGGLLPQQFPRWVISSHLLCMHHPQQASSRITRESMTASKAPLFASLTSPQALLTCTATHLQGRCPPSSGCSYVTPARQGLHGPAVRRLPIPCPRCSPWSWLGTCSAAYLRSSAFAGWQLNIPARVGGGPATWSDAVGGIRSTL